MLNKNFNGNGPRIIERERSPRLDALVSGQKLVIYGIIVYFLFLGLGAATGGIGFLLVPIAMIMYMIGAYRITTGLEYSMLGRVFLVLLLFIPIPFVGLIVLLTLNSKASKQIKYAGYSVGLAGARDY